MEKHRHRRGISSSPSAGGLAAMSVATLPQTPAASPSAAAASGGSTAVKFEAPRKSLASSDAQLERERAAKMGFIYIGLRTSYFYVALLFFGASLWIAAVTVFVDSGGDSESTQKLFLFAVMWCLQTFIIAFCLPYEHWRENFHKVLIGLASLGHSVLLLAVQTNGTQSTFFYAILGIFALLMGFLIFRKYLPCRFMRVGLEEQAIREKARELLSEASQSKKMIDEEGRRISTSDGGAAAGSADHPSAISQLARLRAQKDELLELSRIHAADEGHSASSSSSRGRQQDFEDSESVQTAVEKADEAIRSAKERASTEAQTAADAEREAALKLEVERIQQQEEAERDASFLAKARACSVQPRSLLHVCCHRLEGKSAEEVSKLTEVQLAQILQAALLAYEKTAQERIADLQSSKEQPLVDALPGRTTSGSGGSHPVST